MSKIVDKKSRLRIVLPIIVSSIAMAINGNMLLRLQRNLITQFTQGINLASVQNDIIEVIESDMEERNDGTSLVGTFVRLAWHCAGTYSKLDGSGGSNGGRIRHEPESKWGANAGLDIAKSALDSVKDKHPKLTYADLYTFAGVVAVEYAGGPTIPYRLGRDDYDDGSSSPEGGRLPDADKGDVKATSQHMRDVFYRMGFTDREMVCLIGAHTLGRCHIDRSGYWGPWNKAENKFNNALFTFLLDMKWTKKKTHEGKRWKGPLQYENESGELMMLPSCMAMIQDEKMKSYVTMYAGDQRLFYKDFSAAFGKLLSLGVHEQPCFGWFC
mmetsp:Transcript_31172/g.47730  ORF Transcript_31172/g.47730 Transcript_31172/m.47730 type:complete len:327 (+) Transcript_31172:63-1043(+)